MKQPRTAECLKDAQSRRRRYGRAVAAAGLALLTALQGCASRPRDYWGTWRPINRYQLAPTPIPLNDQYAYYATPMDGTLRNMLRRWAKDSGMQFSYQLPSDYTLTQPVSAIRTTDIRQALADLSSIYAAVGIRLYTLDNEILAKPAPDPAGSRTTRIDEPGNTMADSSARPIAPASPRPQTAQP